jgi:hypothetical protein
LVALTWVAGTDIALRYRACVVGEDGRIASVRAFVCESDADAIVWAKQLVDRDDVELWQLDRFVTRLKAAGKRTAVSYEILDGRMVPKK